jgi:hypothetical protein
MVKRLARSGPAPFRFSPLRFAPGVPLHFNDNINRRELKNLMEGMENLYLPDLTK